MIRLLLCLAVLLMLTGCPSRGQCLPYFDRDGLMHHVCENDAPLFRF